MLVKTSSSTLERMHRGGVTHGRLVVEGHADEAGAGAVVGRQLPGRRSRSCCWYDGSVGPGAAQLPRGPWSQHSCRARVGALAS